MTRVPIINELAEFVIGIEARELPDDLLDVASMAVLDVIAGAVAGAATHNAVSTKQAGLSLFGTGSAPLWFDDKCTRAGGAILANCAAASALDIDDGHRGASGHPGAAIIPAVLTVAASQEAGLGFRDGRRLLTSIIIGYDIALRVATSRLAAEKASYAAGRWCGYGVAAALGWLHDMTPGVLAQAISIAGAEAPQSFPQGACGPSTVKGSSPWGTLTAFASVGRALKGSTGPNDLLDRPEAFDNETILDQLGTRWLITETYLKPYASCRYMHAAIDAVLAVSGEACAGAEPIDALIVETFPEGFTISNDRHPRTLEQAQFSTPFCVALAALRGASALRPLTESSLHDREVLALSEKVELAVADDFVDAFPEMTPARVRLRRGGRQIEETVMQPLGDVGNPLRQSDIESKLRDLSEGLLDDSAVGALIQGVGKLCEGSPERLFQALREAIQMDRGATLSDRDTNLVESH